MAWYNRIANAASRAASRIGRVFTGRPAPPTVEEAPPEPRPVTQGTYELPREPVQPPVAPPLSPEGQMGLPAEEPLAPTDAGIWQAEPTPTERMSDLRGDEFTVYDPLTFDPIQTDYVMTQDDWYREALMPADYLRDRYGWADKDMPRPNIEILLQLEADGYFIDWDQWREQYEAIMG